MTVYVDDMKANFGRMVLCHMLADSDEELHAMAARIGVARKWHQAPPRYRVAWLAGRRCRMGTQPQSAEGSRRMTVRLVWSTPDGEDLIAYMARVSAPDNQDNAATAPRLIGYLIRNRHWSPFEMVNVCFEIETTRDIGRQLLRHRSFTFQEFSQRYADVSALPAAPLREARMQDPKNRQNSTACEDEWLAGWWAHMQQHLAETTADLYRHALDLGIAKEVARAVLPEGLTPSRMYMNGTLRSWLHFVDVRDGHGAQKEATDIARAVRAELAALYPSVMAAFDGAAR